jgi:hypothetical protein
VYSSLCPANRGAVEKPCADIPWHQVQFRTRTDSSANSGPAAKATIARIAIFDVMSFMIQVLALYAFIETGDPRTIRFT